jgi:hypothetical protein
MNAAVEPTTPDRLARLEARVRLLAVVATSLFVALVALAFYSLRMPLGLRVAAREFVLVDSDGRTRGRFGQSELKYADSNNREVTASTNCLMLFGADGQSHLQACSTWDAPPQSSLLMTDSKGQRLTLSADDEGATVSVGRRRDMGKGDDNATVSISAGEGKAAVSLRGRRQRGTVLSLDGVAVFSEDRRTLAKIPDGGTTQ